MEEIWRGLASLTLPQNSFAKMLLAAAVLFLILGANFYLQKILASTDALVLKMLKYALERRHRRRLFRRNESRLLLITLHPQANTNELLCANYLVLDSFIDLGGQDNKSRYHVHVRRAWIYVRFNGAAKMLFRRLSPNKLTKFFLNLGLTLASSNSGSCVGYYLKNLSQQNRMHVVN